MSIGTSERPGLHLRCLACGGSVELAEFATSCPCGRSMARPDGDGQHGYGGPAEASMRIIVHEPSQRAMVLRETPIEDSDSLHRLEVAPLI